MGDGGENQLTGTWAREQGLGVGRGAGGDGGWVGRDRGRRTGGRRRGGGAQHYEPRGRSGLQVPILVRGQPRAGAETSGKTISWNRPPREDRATI